LFQELQFLLRREVQEVVVFGDYRHIVKKVYLVLDCH
jgi:hypothetical protein